MDRKKVAIEIGLIEPEIARVKVMHVPQENTALVQRLDPIRILFFGDEAEQGSQCQQMRLSPHGGLGRGRRWHDAQLTIRARAHGDLVEYGCKGQT